MKNLMIFMSPEHRLDNTFRKMLEIQVDNSLRFWKPEDIMFVANFPYEYKGIKSIETSDLFNSQFAENPRAIINSKIDVFIYLLENKILVDDAWFHDLDAFQLAPLDLKLEKDLALACYGIYPPWALQKLGKEIKETEWGYPRRINFGNVFFKPSALDIFKQLLEKMDKEKLYEEDAMTLMLEDDDSRVQILDAGYDIGVRCTRKNFALAEKPIKIAHFPPNQRRWLRKMSYFIPERVKNLIWEKFDFRYTLVTGYKGFIGSHIHDYLWTLKYNIKGIVEDVRDKESLRPYFKEAEFVIHTAARTKDKGLNDYYEINVEGTRNVAELCLEYGCKMIYLGTIADEGDYGKSKQEAKKIV